MSLQESRVSRDAVLSGNSGVICGKDGRNSDVIFGKDGRGQQACVDSELMPLPESRAFREGWPLQGHLAHTEQPPPQDHHRA